MNASIFSLSFSFFVLTIGGRCCRRRRPPRRRRRPSFIFSSRPLFLPLHRLCIVLAQCHIWPRRGKAGKRKRRRKNGVEFPLVMLLEKNFIFFSWTLVDLNSCLRSQGVSFFFSSWTIFKHHQMRQTLMKLIVSDEWFRMSSFVVLNIHLTFYKYSSSRDRSFEQRFHYVRDRPSMHVSRYSKWQMKEFHREMNILDTEHIMSLGKVNRSKIENEQIFLPISDAICFRLPSL